MLAVLIYCLDDVALFIIFSLFGGIIERKWGKNRRNFEIAIVIANESLRICLNTIIFVYAIALAFHVTIVQLFIVPLALAATALIRLMIVMIIRRENR